MKIMTGLEAKSSSIKKKVWLWENKILESYNWRTIKSFFCHLLRSGSPRQPGGIVSLGPMLSPSAGTQTEQGACLD